jgi:hypothetical protein
MSKKTLKCKKCGIERPSSMFYGYVVKATNECVVCRRIRAKKYYWNNIEKNREKNRQQYKNNPNVKKALYDYKKKYPERHKAVRFINDLKKYHDDLIDVCALCGVLDDTNNFHHENYKLPYVGIWLCRNCHSDIHTKERPYKRRTIR